MLLVAVETLAVAPELRVVRGKESQSGVDVVTQAWIRSSSSKTMRHAPWARRGRGRSLGRGRRHRATVHSGAKLCSEKSREALLRWESTMWSRGIVGLLLSITGIIWIFQGTNVVHGSGMSGHGLIRSSVSCC